MDGRSRRLGESKRTVGRFASSPWVSRATSLGLELPLHLDGDLVRPEEGRGARSVVAEAERFADRRGVGSGERFEELRLLAARPPGDRPPREAPRRDRPRRFDDERDCWIGRPWGRVRGVGPGEIEPPSVPRRRRRRRRRCEPVTSSAPTRPPPHAPVRCGPATSSRSIRRRRPRRCGRARSSPPPSATRSRPGGTRTVAERLPVRGPRRFDPDEFGIPSDLRAVVEGSLDGVVDAFGRSRREQAVPAPQRHRTADGGRADESETCSVHVRPKEGVDVLVPNAPGDPPVRTRRGSPGYV